MDFQLFSMLQVQPASAAADDPDWAPVPPELLFTDAFMEHADMHTGSMPGLRVEVWPAGVDGRVTKPLASRRLDVGKTVRFDLVTLLPGLTPGPYRVQVRHCSPSLTAYGPAGATRSWLGRCWP